MSTTRDIEEMRSRRFHFLYRCFEISGGDELKHLSMFDVGKELGFDESLTMRIAQYLEGEGLIKFRTMGGGIAISHRGVRHMERALCEPDAPTEYFPAVNIIQVGRMVDSHIQQASPSGIQVIGAQYGLEQLQEVVQSLVESVDQLALELSLGEQEKTDLLAHIKTVEAQMQASGPRTAIVKQCLSSIVAVIRGASVAVAGSLLAQQLLEKIETLQRMF